LSDKDGIAIEQRSLNDGLCGDGGTSGCLLGLQGGWSCADFDGLARRGSAKREGNLNPRGGSHVNTALLEGAEALSAGRVCVGADLDGGEGVGTAIIACVFECEACLFIDEFNGGVGDYSPSGVQHGTEDGALVHLTGGKSRC
jgi:hypothetical protein